MLTRKAVTFYEEGIQKLSYAIIGTCKMVVVVGKIA